VKIEYPPGITTAPEIVKARPPVSAGRGTFAGPGSDRSSLHPLRGGGPAAAGAADTTGSALGTIVAHGAGGAENAGGAAVPKTAAETASPVAKKLAELEKVSSQFETLLYKQMIHTMIEGSTENGYYGEGSEGDIWGGLFESGLADAVSGGNSLGLARQIYGQFEKTVRAQMKANPSAGSDTPAPAAPADPQKP